MLKIFSDLRDNDNQLYADVVAACKAEPDSNSWFMTKTFGELKQAASFINAHSWEIDMQKLMHRFTSYEWTILQSLLQTNKPAKLEAREQQCKTAGQKTERFVKHWLETNETRMQIAELQSQIKRRKLKSDFDEGWEKLQKIF
ncbi:hypothetical protein [Agaribacterium haliotis]|uniref:hypothetical protein n=1 Tax=Agaribacterium haliotis TaxID=2013869 RepID=UPI000BB53E3A|nr:hypothetical protein [Agaribacterium haliotis]